MHTFIKKATLAGAILALAGVANAQGPASTSDGGQDNPSFQQQQTTTQVGYQLRKRHIDDTEEVQFCGFVIEDGDIAGYTDWLGFEQFGVQRLTLPLHAVSAEAKEVMWIPDWEYSDIAGVELGMRFPAPNQFIMYPPGVDQRLARFGLLSANQVAIEGGISIGITFVGDEGNAQATTPAAGPVDQNLPYSVVSTPEITTVCFDRGGGGFGFVSYPAGMIAYPTTPTPVVVDGGCTGGPGLLFSLVGWEVCGSFSRGGGSISGCVKGK